jgi:tetratricopeptide (TPR) repeat protein
MRVGQVWTGLVTAVLLLLPAAGVGAQGMDQRTEALRLREAAALEWRGRLDEAQAVLVRLLDEHPTSSGALFGLERIMRNLGRVDEVLLFADEYLRLDPSASGVRYMKLRILAEVDSLDAIWPEAEAWFRAEPGSPDPYRETARVVERALGPDEALALLDRGLSTLGGHSALAMEKGDLLAQLGRDREAVEEWSRALADPGADLAGILRRAGRLTGDARQVADPLIETLFREPTTVERRRAAVLMAMELGLEDRAGELARRLRGELGGQDALSFLREVSARADGAGDPALALWALEEERRLVPDRERITLDLRIASTALQAGDTATAVRAQGRLTRSLPEGSVERRRVMADLIRVETTSGSAETVVARLGTFRAEYPGAPESDELHALTANSLLARGREELALDVLGRSDGPLTALEGAFVALARGETGEGEEALRRAAPGLPPVRATRVLRLLSTLEEVSPRASRLLGVAAAGAHRGALEASVDTLVSALPDLEDDDRPALMAWAAEAAQAAGQGALADELLSAVVTGYPASRAYAEASLALARLRLEEGEREEARALLEALILSRPGSPVIPAARRELQRLRSAPEPALRP